MDIEKIRKAADDYIENPDVDAYGFAFRTAACPAAVLELIRQRDELLAVVRDAGCLLDMLRTGENGEKHDYVNSRHKSMMLVGVVVDDAKKAIANAESQS